MDKNKIIEAATKFVQKGQYDKAIKEYVKLLEADPKDSRILQKIGELYQKKGDNAEAANYFLKVGESYSADGFFLKAVAVYKQVLKLDDKRVDVNLKLAELYQQLGLMSDAMAQLQIVSAYYEKSGDNQASLDLLKRMVELDPDNIASRIKLAELYARDNIQTEAVNEFSKAAQYLKRNNRIDDYIKVAERLVFLDPGNVELARELAQIYLAKQDTKRALAKLQVCFKADPRDVETLNLLAQAFLELGQTSKTVSVYKELAKIYDEQDKVDDERAVWEKIREIAPDDPDLEKHQAPAQPAAAAAPVAAVQPPSRGAPAASAPTALGPEQIAKLLTETDVYVKYGLHDKALDHLKKVFAADPDNLEGHDKAYQLAKAAAQHGRAEEELVRVIQLGIAQGDHDRARERLQELLEQNPGHPEVAGFLEVLGSAAPPAEEVVDDSILIESDDAEVLEEPAAEAVVEDEALAASGDDELLATGDDEPLAMADDEPLASADESVVEVSAGSIEDEALLAASGGDEQLVADDESLLAEEQPEPTSSFELVSSAEDEALAAASVDAGDEALVAGDEAGTADEVVAGADDGELATIDYGSAELIEAGAGPADEILAADDQVFAVPEADGASDARETTSELSGSSELSDAPSVRSGGYDEPEPEDANQATRVVNLADLAAADDRPTRAKMQTAPPEAVRTDAKVPAARPTTKPGNGRGVTTSATLGAVKAAGKAETKVETRPAKSETKPSVNLAKELAKPAARPPSKSLKAAPLPVQPAEPESEDAASDELEEAAFFISQGDLDEAREILETVLLAFPRNARAKELLSELEAKQSGAGATTDGDQSFDLAAELAEELGEATGEQESKPLQPGEDGFQISHQDVFAEFKKGVAKVVKPEDVDTHYDLGIAYKEMGLLDDAIGEFEQAMAGAVGKPREIDCHVAIATCKRDKGDMAGAIETFRKGLSFQQVNVDATKAMLYDLANAYEAVGQANRALGSFQKILTLDPRYRDVNGQAERLKAAGATPEDEPKNGVHVNGKAGATASRPPSGGSAGKPASRKIGYV